MMTGKEIFEHRKAFGIKDGKEEEGFQILSLIVPAILNGYCQISIDRAIVILEAITEMLRKIERKDT